MTLFEIIEIWKLQNETDFWDVFTLPDNLDKEALVNHILYEYGTMEPVDTNSGFFRERIRTFFKIHEWNILKLAGSLEFKYDPLADRRWHEKNIRYTDETVDFTSARDVNTDFTQNEDETVETGHTDSITTGEIELMHDDTTTGKIDLEHGMLHSHIKEDWTETDTMDDTKTDYVSAYNMDISPNGQILNDTEHHRDVEHQEIDKKGDDEKTQDDETWKTNHTGESTDDWKSTHTGSSTDELHTVDTTDVKDTTSNTKTDDDMVSEKVTDNDMYFDIWQHGNKEHSFQSLIEEERRQAKFNIYKWIGDHFSKECLICIW